ncbi:MAG: hypothetical protein AAGN46_13885 [Acidobacteriota bacterium]
MKKVVFLFLVAASLVFAGAAAADTLTVNANAAMGGTNFGLDVFHDNTSGAFVEDLTPDDESVYRASFLFNPNDISPGANLRQPIFIALGSAPASAGCAGPAFANTLRLYLYLSGGAGQNYRLQLWGNNNQCSSRSTTRVPVSENTPSRVCVEFEAGASSTGRLALAVVGENDVCPTSGTGAWAERAMTNNLQSITRVRMGTPATNGFNAGESGSMFYDEFDSFRTLAP